MPALTGDPLEVYGREVLASLGLPCISGRRQVLLRRLDPSGSHPRNDHIEIDYLIPMGRAAALGEITSRGSNNLDRKHRAFVRAFHLVEGMVERLPQQTVARRNSFWQ